MQFNAIFLNTLSEESQISRDENGYPPRQGKWDA